MKVFHSDKILYRIYIRENGVRYYLCDWIIYDKKDHLRFDTECRYAMTFDRWAIAMRYRDRMVSLGYDPHIEQA